MALVGKGTVSVVLPTSEMTLACPSNAPFCGGRESVTVSVILPTSE
jgi:hypothetical protein